MIPYNFLNLSRRLFEHNCGWHLTVAVVVSIIAAVSFSAFFLNWYNDRSLPLLRKPILIPNRINESRNSPDDGLI
jgi:hypothetical protein